MRKTAFTVAIALALIAAVGCGAKTSPLEKGGINAMDLLQTLNARTTRVLGTITGSAAAEAALPDLEAISSSYDDLADAAKGLSPEGRERLAAECARILPGLRDNATRLSAMRGGEVIAPVLREITDKVAALQ